ncbi:MAG TPA: hypothetical protein DIW24_02475 [Bacteroidetes bacterium]|nr:hypothetical protein [Bacteroidota bacterium]HRR09669.1 DUF3098 domain-containing protein [Rhodothermales bacterium]
MAKQNRPKNTPKTVSPPLGNPIATEEPNRRAERRMSIALNKKGAVQMPFDRQNYLILLVCVGLLVVGYGIMRIENEAFGFISLYISPLLLLAGYFGIVYAILKRPNQEEVH